MNVSANVDLNVDVDVNVNVDVNADVDVNVDANMDVNVDLNVDVHMNLNVNVDVDVKMDLDVNANLDVDANVEGSTRGMDLPWLHSTSPRALFRSDPTPGDWARRTRQTAHTWGHRQCPFPFWTTHPPAREAFG